MEASPVDFDGRDHWWDLFNHPGEVGRGRSHVLGRDRGHVPLPGHLTRGVERRRRRPEHDVGLIGLGQCGQEAQQSGGPAEADQQDAGGVWVEGPGVATRRCPKTRRQRATTSWTSTPASLSITTSPVELT